MEAAICARLALVIGSERVVPELSTSVRGRELLPCCLATKAFVTNQLDPRMKHVPEPWSQPIQDWSGWLAAGGWTRETISTRTAHLRRAARELQGSPWAVAEQRLVEWVGQQKWSLETRRSNYASLRLFWVWAVGTVADTPSLARCMATCRPGMSASSSPHSSPTNGPDTPCVTDLAP